MEEYVIICDDGIDGILSGIFDAYQYKKDNMIERHDLIHLETGEPYTRRLFTQYTYSKSDNEKVEKVSRTIKRELGDDTFYDLCLAMVSYEDDKADAVYHTIVSGLKHHDKNILSRLCEPYVYRAFSCMRKSAHELHQYTEFLRFAELQNGIMYAKIGAKSNILPFLMPHFSDRLPADDFVIYDELHGTFGLHPKYKQWYLATNFDFDEESLNFSEKEKAYSELFTHFCQSIAIESRVNPSLQLNMLPLKFRKYMVEFPSP